MSDVMYLTKLDDIELEVEKFELILNILPVRAHLKRIAYIELLFQCLLTIYCG